MKNVFQSVAIYLSWFQRQNPSFEPGNKIDRTPGVILADWQNNSKGR